MLVVKKSILVALEAVENPALSRILSIDSSLMAFGAFGKVRIWDFGILVER